MATMGIEGREAPPIYQQLRGLREPQSVLESTNGSILERAEDLAADFRGGGDVRRAKVSMDRGLPWIPHASGVPHTSFGGGPMEGSIAVDFAGGGPCHL